ncbi:MAG: hypothetical protein KDL87_19005, partial [Verrucomicrobiae bacterium]|nr:hypothetical protein [Verrucomicrobiae bacterium]
EIGRHIDGHQILFHGQSLFVTATRENALIRLNPETGAQSLWNWTGHNTDVNHINGLAPGPDGGLLVSHDNRGGTASEIVTLSAAGEVTDRIDLGFPELGSHNIEGNHVTASGQDSVLWQLAPDGTKTEVFRRSGEFFRGLGRCRTTNGQWSWLVGASGVMPRELRGLPQAGWIHQLSGNPLTLGNTVAIPEIGQIYELRSLDPECSHNGLPCPLKWDSGLEVTDWRPVAETKTGSPR